MTKCSNKKTEIIAMHKKCKIQLDAIYKKCPFRDSLKVK